MNDSNKDQPEAMRSYEERAAKGREASGTAVEDMPMPGDASSTKMTDPQLLRKKVDVVSHRSTVHSVQDANDVLKGEDDEDDGEGEDFGDGPVVIAGRRVQDEVMNIIMQNAAFLAVRTLYSYVAEGRLPKTIGMDFKYVAGEMDLNVESMYEAVDSLTRAELTAIAAKLQRRDKTVAEQTIKTDWPKNHFMYSIISAVNNLGEMLCKFEAQHPSMRGSTMQDMREITIDTLSGFVRLLSSPGMASLDNWLQVPKNEVDGVATLAAASNNVGVRTGRASCTEPNYSPLPKKMDGVIGKPAVEEKLIPKSPGERIMDARRAMDERRKMTAKTISENTTGVGAQEKESATDKLDSLRERVRVAYNISDVKMLELDLLISKAKLAASLNRREVVKELISDLAMNITFAAMEYEFKNGNGKDGKVKTPSLIDIVKELGFDKVDEPQGVMSDGGGQRKKAGPTEEQSAELGGMLQKMGLIPKDVDLKDVDVRFVSLGKDSEGESFIDLLGRRPQ